MLYGEKSAAGTPPRSDSQEWVEFLGSIVSFVEFRCRDSRKCYLELKELADSQLADPDMSLQVTLYYVADLCDITQQKLISTNDQELTGAWANSSAAAPTQQLGEALYAIPVSGGFLFPSSKVGSRNLATFPDKLDARSSIIFQNELDGKSERFI